MAVAAEPDPALEPDLAGARDLAREANVIPVSYRFVDDCETPVSAFLKLRDAFPGASFLLESAEQGRLGRYSFLGFKPRVELRWSDGKLTSTSLGEVVVSDAPDPYGTAAEELGRFRIATPERLPPFPGGAVGFFGYDLVRTVEPLAEPNPDPLGLPDMALMVCELMLAFDHLRHEVTVIAYAFCDEIGADAAYDRALELIGDARAALRGRSRLRVSDRMSRPPAAAGLVRARGRRRSVAFEPEPRALRVQRRADRRVRPRRRCLPGGAIAAFHRAGAGRGLLDLPRPAHGQPVAVHVLPRLRRLRDRRRLARAAGEGLRPPSRDTADRGHLPARRHRGGGHCAGGGAARRPEGARRARDVGRPRAQ